LPIYLAVQRMPFQFIVNDPRVSRLHANSPALAFHIE
jgi:hypothetical protein